jgi:protein tyrosine/serine phosphatase
MRQKYALPALVLLTFIGAIRSTLSDDQIPIKNFHEVETGIYRGAAPDDAGTAYLESIHLKTDIDLESFRFWAILDERSDNRPDDILFKSERLSSWPGILSFIQPPITNHRIDEILDIMNDESQQPVFVHCQRGEDRTGMVVGLYRVLKQGWTPEAAWNEMLEWGYHPHFRALTNYFEKRTDWKPSS